MPGARFQTPHFTLSEVGMKDISSWTLQLESVSNVPISWNELFHNMFIWKYWKHMKNNYCDYIVKNDRSKTCERFLLCCTSWLLLITSRWSFAAVVVVRPPASSKVCSVESIHLKISWTLQVKVPRASGCCLKGMLFGHQLKMMGFKFQRFWPQSRWIPRRWMDGWKDYEGLEIHPTGFLL